MKKPKAMLLARGCRRSARSFSSLRTDAAQTYDVLIVGGGVIGAWAAIAAKRLGASVALADQFSPAHEHGSSHGDGRIYRFAYIENLYVDMMERSLPQWTELQAFAGEELMAQTGGLQTAPAGKGRLQDQVDLYARRGIAHELLSAREANERFPQFGLEDNVEALYQRDFGVLFASKCVRAAWRYAESLGVQTLTPFRASALHVRGGGGGNGHESGHNTLVVEGANGASVSARSAVFAPGAWLSSLSASLLRLEVPTHVTAETVCYYAPKDSAVDHSYHTMPCFLPDFDNGLGPFGYYGLPMIGIPGIKASAHYCGPIIDPERRPMAAGGTQVGLVDSVVEASAAARVEAVVASTNRLIASHFPHVESTPFMRQSCLYTTTPDHDYILSTLPGGPENVVLVGGGSGHAFKMGPALGEGAAALALGLPPPFPAGQFDVRRLLNLGARAMDREPFATKK